jgi:DNA polymerase-1
VSKTLVLVDGSSYLYRAYHALERANLRSASGEPTGAVYGVINMLAKLLVDFPADYCACVFDAKGKTFRDDWYPEYKATRAAMPEDLATQIEPLHECIRALGWPLVMVDGVEADDVIGTLVRQAEAEGMKSIISTGDKDLTQLVNPRVLWVNTMSNERLDGEGVKAKFGVPPERIVDYLTLIGDSIDNVPGVDKVGPKTACKWLQQYGGLDEVVAHAGDIGGAVGENLRKALDWLPTARKLVTVKVDVPLDCKPEDLKLGKRDVAKLTELYTRLGFKTMLRDLQNTTKAGKELEREAGPTDAGPSTFRPFAAPVAAAQGAEFIATREYETISDEAGLQRWVAAVDRAPLTAFDTETSGVDPLTAKLVGLSISVEPGRAAYVPLAHNYAGAPEQIGVERALAMLRPWLEDADKPKLGQNVKFDQHILANHGVALAGVAQDTLLESYVLESHQRHDMDALAMRVLGAKTTSYDEVTGTGAKRIPFEQVEVARAAEYAAEDADVTLQVHGALFPRIAADEKLKYIYQSIEIPVREVLYRVERNGVLIDAAQLSAQTHELGQKMLDLEARAYSEAGQPFNLNSPKQIAEIFFERKGMPVVKKTPSGAPSTDEEVLARLALDHPLAKMLLDYREISKLKSTYTDKLPRMVNAATGRVHTTYGQATAVTGRLASNDPNLQNIPVRTAEGRRIREAFVAPTGSVILSADYSQVELRIMAHLSGDESLLSAFAAGEDIHRATAAEVFGRKLAEVSAEERRYAKTINFGLIYGMSAFGLAQQMGVERATAQSYIQSYFLRYPGVKRYMDETRAQAKETGFVETVFGRRLWLPEIRSSNAGRRGNAERAAINAPMQGTAADLIKLAMIATQKWLDEQKLQTKIIMQVHDELVFEVPEVEKEKVMKKLPELMGGVASLKVPLLVDVGVGPNWEKAH